MKIELRTGRERKRKIGRAVEDLLPAYFAPLLRLIFKWTTSMCFFRVLALPNATPLQTQTWSLRFSCTVLLCVFRWLFSPKATPLQ